MCVLSMVMDHYGDKWQTLAEEIQKQVSFTLSTPVPFPIPESVKLPRRITDEEIDELHRWIERAREYDKKYDQEECEMAEKKEKLFKLAEELGIREKVQFLE